MLKSRRLNHSACQHIFSNHEFGPNKNVIKFDDWMLLPLFPLIHFLYSSFIVSISNYLSES